MSNSSSNNIYELNEDFILYALEENANIKRQNKSIGEEAVSVIEHIDHPQKMIGFTSYYCWKKVIDKIFAAIGIAMLSPILLIVALLIKIDSKGPVLFTQERVGKNSMPFKIYKFRTMKIDAPNIPTNSMKDSKEYLTRSGSILRRLSIDEFPQLFNIIKGEMSFIGPRPMINKHEYLINMRKQKGIDVLLPGISGLAQISGRDEISDQEKFKYDEHYFKNFNFKTDIKILLKTIHKVLCKENITL